MTSPVEEIGTIDCVVQKLLQEQHMSFHIYITALHNYNIIVGSELCVISFFCLTLVTTLAFSAVGCH